MRRASGSATNDGGDRSPAVDANTGAKRKREGETEEAANSNSSSNNPKQQRRGKFVEGEIVYAYHGPMLYEAKILETGNKTTSSTGKKIKKCKIHYRNWNAKYDDWVEDSMLLKVNETNTRLLQNLGKELKEQKNNISTGPGSKKLPPAAKATTAAAPAGTISGKSTTEAAVAVPEHVDTVMETVQSNETEPKIVIPLPLKKQLVDDWERITQKHLLVEVPRNINVRSFLQEFVEAKSKKGDRDAALHQMAHSLRTLFDLALPKILLYRFERLQYEELIEREPGKKLSDIYGVEHFLRMFVKLPPLLAQIGASEDELRGLRSKLQDMLKFLQRKKDTFLSGTAYVKASLPYMQAFERNLGGGATTSASSTANASAASAPESDSLSASVQALDASMSNSAPQETSETARASATEAVAQVVPSADCN